MDYERKYKWAIAGLIVMVLLNAITLGSLWLNEPDGESRADRNRPERDHMQQFMKKELNLTDAQTDSIRVLRRQQLQEAGDHMQQLSQTRGRYFDAVMDNGTTAITPKQKEALTDSLSHQYLLLEQMLYRHITEVGRILTDEQRPKYEQLMKDTFIHRHRGKGKQQRGRK